jgi:hypothetical protein
MGKRKSAETIVIDPSVETVFVFADSMQHVGKSDSTVRRYCFEGYLIHKPDGGDELIFLDTIKTPGGWATSVEAYHRFITTLDQLAKNKNGDPPQRQR